MLEQTEHVLCLVAEIILEWSSPLLVLHDILLDIRHKDGGKDSGREKDSFSRCHGAVGRDAWRAHRQESDPAEEPGEEKTRCGNKVVQTPGTVTALASFLGSGNTWLRYLLQQVTGKRRD